MESKGLDIKSFHQNQKLLDAINLLLIHLKLSSNNIQSAVETENVEHAKQFLLAFLQKLEGLVIKVEQREEDPIVGTDVRLRSFAKSFVDAKGRKSKFTSSLFQSSISAIRAKIENAQTEDSKELIQSLSELRLLLEEQLSIDSKSIINEI